MPDKGHWPFTGGPSAYGARDQHTAKEGGEERARLAEETAMRQKARMNRLIVGGRAHTKKRGLS